MSTANNVELLIITIVLCILFLALTAVAIEVLIVVSRINRLAHKASGLIDNVESAASALKDLARAKRGRFPLLSLFQSIVNMNSKKK